MIANFDEKSDFILVHNAILGTSLVHSTNMIRTTSERTKSVRLITAQDAVTCNSLLQYAPKFTDTEPQP